MNNNISFQGHSTLMCSPKKYADAYKAAVSQGRRLHADNTCNLANGQRYTSVADAAHLAVIIRNEKAGRLKQVTVGHNIEETLAFITETIDTLKKNSKEKLTAWIIGGDKIQGKNGDNTIKTFNEIAEELCDRPDIDTSILVGSKSAEDKFFLHTLGGELEVGLDKSSNPLKQPNLSAEEKMGNYFDIVELNNTDIKTD